MTSLPKLEPFLPRGGGTARSRAGGHGAEPSDDGDFADNLGTTTNPPWRATWSTGMVAALAVLAALALRTWCVQGLLIPVRVVSGSMGDVLPGPHWDVTCRDCGLRFACGTDCPPRQDIVCPNCGALNPLGPAVLSPGRRVLIDRLTLSLRRPRRWEVVVARLPGHPPHLAVKRVVGLPGERIRIHHGDIYANETIVRKNIEQQREMAVLVHDSQFRPAEKTKAQARWKAQSDASRWRNNHGRFRFAPIRAQSSGDVAVVRGTDRVDHDRLDWLVYHHRSCLPLPDGSERQLPITDNYSYNQGLSRDLFQTTDVLLSCRVRLSGQGVLAVRAHDGHEMFQVQWEPNRKHLALLREATVVSVADLPAVRLGRPMRLEVMICDAQVQLALDGQTYLAYTYAAGDLPRQPTAIPLAVGAAGLTAEIDRLRVWRDVYYTHPDLVARDWSLAEPLGAREYLLLGDNSPISVDGRHGAAEGRVSREAILGRVVPSPRWPRQARFHY